MLYYTVIAAYFVEVPDELPDIQLHIRHNMLYHVLCVEDELDLCDTEVAAVSRLFCRELFELLRATHMAEPVIRRYSIRRPWQHFDSKHLGVDIIAHSVEQKAYSPSLGLLDSVVECD